MSGECTPLLGTVVPMFKMFIVQWDALSKLVPQCSPFIKAGLECAKQYYKHMGNTHAYIIAMRKSILIYGSLLMFVVVNPTIRLTWIMQHWSDEDKVVEGRLYYAVVMYYIQLTC